MSKMVPIEKEKAYIALDKKFELLKAEHQLEKQKMLGYNEKGYTFSLLRFSDTSAGVFNPPWKKIALALLKKLYPKESMQKAFHKKLRKRYPPTERTPSVLIPGKKVTHE